MIEDVTTTCGGVGRKRSVDGCVDEMAKHDFGVLGHPPRDFSKSLENGRVGNGGLMGAAVAQRVNGIIGSDNLWLLSWSYSRFLEN